MDDPKARPAPPPSAKKNRAEKMARVQWVIGITVSLVVVVLSRLGALERLEYPLLDFNARNFHDFVPPPDQRLVMVAIDDASISSVGKWPWPRELIAQVVRELHRAGAGVIATDLLLDDPQPVRIDGDLSDPSTLRVVDGDAELASAIKSHGTVVLGGSFNIPLGRSVTDDSGSTKSVPMSEVLRHLITHPDATDAELQAAFLSADEADRAGGAMVDELRLKARQARLLLDRAEQFSVPVPPDPMPWAESPTPDPPVPPLLDAAARLATVSFGSTDMDGGVRRIPMWVRQAGRLYPTLGLAGAAALLGVNTSDIRIEGDDTVLKLPKGAELRLHMHTARLNKIGKVAGLYYVTWPRGGGWETQFTDESMLREWRQTNTRRAEERVTPESLGLPPLGEADTPCGPIAFDVRRDVTSDLPPGLDLPIGKLLDPHLAGARIKANLRSNDQSILTLSSLDYVKEGIGLIDDLEKYRARSGVLQSLDIESDAWRAAYAEHRMALLAAADNARFFLQSFAEAVPQGQALSELESNQRSAACQFLSAVYTMIGEIDVRLDDIKLLRDSLRRRVQGKLCMIGWTGTGAIADFVQTSIDARTPGVYVHGAMANSVFTQYARQVSGTGSFIAGLIMLFSMGILGTMIGVRMGVFVGPVVLVATSALCALVGGWLVWDRAGQVTSFAAPLAAGGASWLAVLLHRLLVEQRGRRQTEARFRSYVSSDVVDILVNNPELQSMAPQRRELTIMFSDVANWTTLTERLGTEGIYKFLSKYLGEMTDIIQKNKATLDKYLGDGIMAFWGAPIEDPDHAKNASIACVEMVKRLNEMNRNGDFGDAGTVEVRFGIATGEVNVGDFGNPPYKSAYTVIGDAVNLAARLESSNKQFGTSILMTRRVLELSRAEVLFRPIGRIVVKGKTEYEELYELIGDYKPKGDRTQEWVDLTSAAIDNYQQGDLDRAESLFHRLADDFDDGKLAKLYLGAIEELRRTGIPKGWEGTVVLTEK